MNNNPAVLEFFKSHDYILKEQENLFKAFKRLGLKGEYKSKEKDKLAEIAADWLLCNNSK